MPIVGRGGEATLRAHVRNGAGQPCDATSLTFGIKDPDGVLLAGFPVVEPTIVRDALGEYHYVWTVSIDLVEGTYSAEWSGYVLGSPATGIEPVEVVAPGSIIIGATLTWLEKPDDYDGIRSLLGVTFVDLPDETIEALPFGPHAEILVKAEITDWEDIPVDDPRWLLCRLAASYATAALIAESNAKGGFLGLLRGEGSRSGAEWTEISKTFWGYFQRLVDQGEDPYGDVMYDFPWHMVAHPTETIATADNGGFVGNLYNEGWF